MNEWKEKKRKGKHTIKTKLENQTNTTRDEALYDNLTFISCHRIPVIKDLL
jgi:hypothetical protein